MTGSEVTEAIKESADSEAAEAPVDDVADPRTADEVAAKDPEESGVTSTDAAALDSVSVALLVAGVTSLGAPLANSLGTEVSLLVAGMTSEAALVSAKPLRVARNRESVSGTSEAESATCVENPREAGAPCEKSDVGTKKLSVADNRVIALLLVCKSISEPESGTSEIIKEPDVEDAPTEKSNELGVTVDREEGSNEIPDGTTVEKEEDVFNEASREDGATLASPLEETK